MTKLYVSKTWMKTRNESRQNTRETRQTTIFRSIHCCPTLLVGVMILYILLAHIFLAVNDLQNIVKLYTLLSRFYGNGGCRTCLRVWSLHFSIAPVTQQRGRGNILRRYNVCFPVNFFYLWHSSREQQPLNSQFYNHDRLAKANLNIPLYLKIG